MPHWPTTAWCQDSFLVHDAQTLDRSYTCRPQDVFSDWTQQTDQKGAESNSYRGMCGQVSGSGRGMSDCPTTGWCQHSFTMLKHRPTDRSYTCRHPDDIDSDVFARIERTRRFRKEPNVMDIVARGLV